LFAAVLTADCALLASVPRRTPIFGILAPFGIVAFAVFLGLGRPLLKTLREEIPFHRRWFGIHILLVLSIYGMYMAAARGPRDLSYSLAAHIFAITILFLGIALLALACIPLRSWTRMVRVTSPLWLVASLAGVVAAYLRRPLQAFWDSSVSGHGGFLQVMAFRSVHVLLRVFLPNVIVDPNTFVVGTQRFAVMIEEQCSGLEGLGLVLVFTLVWLWYFRKESRFPQALLLVPCALGLVWMLNIVRICAIVLIGNAGAPDIAMVGFHSQAGWIAFTAVALGFSMATRRLSWVRSMPAYSSVAVESPAGGSATTGVDAAGVVAAGVVSGESPATAAYLVPFLAILAASFFSKAASGYFEWLYPLRFLAAAIAIWHFRGTYRKLDWRFGWLAPVTGVAIFLVWIAPEWIAREWWTEDHAASSLGAALAALTPTARVAWIAFRVAAASITVPIAEELAFRGYLTRRIIDREFDRVPFTGLTLLSVGLSSVVFGVMHGQHWFVGILAGLAYAAVLKWRGRIGDAIVAHATSNLLLAAWVLLRGDWAQW
jgi:exosortase E/protease (VPEID-CTERM system)